MAATFLRTCKKRSVGFGTSMEASSKRARLANKGGILHGISLALFVSLFVTSHADAQDGHDRNMQDRAQQFKDEIGKAVEKHHADQTSEQSKIYKEIVVKYFSHGMTIKDAVYILKYSGFNITVFGDGFYTSYPAEKGNSISGCLSYPGGFLSGGSMCVNLALYRDGDFSNVKAVEVGVGTINP